MLSLSLPRSLTAAVSEVFGGSTALPEGLRFVASRRLGVPPGVDQCEARRPVSHRHPQTEETCHRVATVTVVKHYRLSTTAPSHHSNSTHRCQNPSPPQTLVAMETQ